MSRISGAIVALAMSAMVLGPMSTDPTTSEVPRESPAAAGSTADLPRTVPGGVELTLADGDLLRIWAADDHRAVWSKRRDAATGTWGGRRKVLRERNLFCGAVDARTANGAVAAIARCDDGAYIEEDVPTASRALWSPDGATWSSYALEGEAYDEPGISPDGQHAVWPQDGRYVTRSPAGFDEHTIDSEGQEVPLTATITDAAQVSFLYFVSLARGCRLVVLTRTGDAVPARQDLETASGCGYTALDNVDSNTVWSDGRNTPAHRTVVSRADPASPWTIAAIAPVDAPGLEQAWNKLDQRYFTAPGLPLFALGSPDRRFVLSQTYDPVAQSWSPPVTVYDVGRWCDWGDTSSSESIGVLVAELRCGQGRRVALTSGDGTSWRALQGSRTPRGLSADGRYVVVPARSRTYVISRERGVVSLPVGVSGRCDVAVPDGPDGAVLLTSAGRNRGWPTVLQHSTPEGWSRLSRTSLPTPRRDCRSLQASGPTFDSFDIGWRVGGYTVRIVERDGRWTARRVRW